jgi:hypothetical protein
MWCFKQKLSLSLKRYGKKNLEKIVKKLNLNIIKKTTKQKAFEAKKQGVSLH